MDGGIILYCHIHVHAEIYIYMLDTYQRNDKHAGRLLRKIFTSHLIARVRKSCVGFYCERELETEHNWNILTPKLWPSALYLSRSPGLLNRSPGVRSIGCWVLAFLLSLPNLVYFRLQLYSTELNCPLLFNSSALYYLQTPTWWYGHASAISPISGDRDVSLSLSLAWPVWSSSSGNNCHAVQRSLSSGASVYESIMGFFLPRPISAANFRPRDFLS